MDPDIGRGGRGYFPTLPIYVGGVRRLQRLSLELPGRETIVGFMMVATLALAEAELRVDPFASADLQACKRLRAAANHAASARRPIAFDCEECPDCRAGDGL